MEGFTYTNIFETKGIEYIAIVGFFLILVPFWIYVMQSPKVKKRVKEVIKFFSFEKLRIPEGLYYDRSHTWAFLDKDGTASVGADDFLVQLTGEVNLENLKAPGEKVNKGDVLAEAEKDGKRLQLLAPVSGEIQKTNTALADMPHVLTEDPYGKGWIYKLKPTNWQNDTRDHYIAEDAKNWSKNEVTRFKDFLAKTFAKSNPEGAMVLQDGGELVAHTLSKLPEDVWSDFQKDFLNPSA